MPVMGHYKVTFMRTEKPRSRLDVYLSVGDGQHPVAERAMELMQRQGYVADEWELVYAKELSELPPMVREITPYDVVSLN